jgi:DNA-directed RNA polymerase specialized sigma24 family protein
MNKILRKTASLSKRKLNVIRGEIAVAHGDNEYNLLQRALYKTNDHEVSKDLVQTTFLKTLVYLQNGGKIDLMRSFLNHVLNDLIVDEYRSRKKKTVSLDMLIENGFEPGTSDFERYVNIFDGKGIVLLISQLPKKYKFLKNIRW